MLKIRTIAKASCFVFFINPIFISMFHWFGEWCKATRKTLIRYYEDIRLLERNFSITSCAWNQVLPSVAAFRN